MIESVSIVKCVRRWEVCGIIGSCSDMLLLLDLLLFGILLSLLLLLDVIVDLSLVDLDLLLPVITLGARFAVILSDLLLLCLLESLARLASLGNIA